MKLTRTAACLLLIGALAACGQSDATNGAAGSPVPDLGDQADPAIVTELPISSRSFRMGTAGFVPAGWPTEELPNGVAGSDQAQIHYLLELARQADELDTVAIIWVFPNDGEFNLAGGIFDHISLRDNQGGPKPAYEYWRALHLLPQR